MIHLSNTRKAAGLVCCLLSIVSAGPAIASQSPSVQSKSARASSTDAASATQSRLFCIFDPNGAAGLIYQSYDSYVVQARAWGYRLTRQSYNDEAVLANDFKAGRCDIAAMTGFRAREFVKFSGSLDMAGGLQRYRDEKKAVKAISSPKAASYMSDNGYVVAGILPLGKAYLFARDRDDLTRKNGLVGKKIAVLNYDEQASSIAKAAGAAPVPASITAFANLFNNGAVDMAYAPATAYGPFELAKGMGSQGGVSDFVLGIVSDQLVAHQARFDDGFGLRSRHWVLDNLFDSMLAQVRQAEQAIPASYWVQLSHERSHDYQQMIRDARASLWDRGWYSHRMQHLLKKIRCADSPAAAECTAPTEGGAVD